MRDFRDAKAMAQTLREALKAKSVSLTHSESLELVARTLGFPDWNFLAARIQASQPASAPAARAHVPPAETTGDVIPIIPIRDIVLFPQMVIPIFVGREKTRRAVESAMAADGRVLVVKQLRSGDDDPALDALYSVGAVASIINCLTQVDGTLKIFVSGLDRATITRPADREFLAAEIAPLEQANGHTAQAAALSRTVLEAYQVYAKVDFSALPQGQAGVLRLPSLGNPGILADSVAPLLSVGVDQRQKILETADVVARLEMILELMKAGQQAA